MKSGKKGLVWNVKLKNKEDEDNNSEYYMRPITARIMLAVLGGGLLYYSLNNLTNIYLKGMSFNSMLSLLSFLGILLSFIMIYKARYY